jgi:hypothetical protein
MKSFAARMAHAFCSKGAVWEGEKPRPKPRLFVTIQSGTFEQFVSPRGFGFLATTFGLGLSELGAIGSGNGCRSGARLGLARLAQVEHLDHDQAAPG